MKKIGKTKIQLTGNSSLTSVIPLTLVKFINLKKGDEFEWYYKDEETIVARVIRSESVIEK